jgi:hypothetical protein
MELMVSGMVEVFAEIRPKHLRFTGQAGELMTTVVEIIPQPKFPFKIKNVRAMNGQHIQLSLADKVQNGRMFFKLTVTGSRQEPGRISDVIHLETDSPIRPLLQVPVFGLITEARKEPS